VQAKITNRVTINASAKEVFHYLSDPSLHYLWNPPLQSITATKPLKKGTTYRATSLLLGVLFESTNTVSAYEQDKLLEIRNSGAALDFCVIYNLEAQGKSTVVQCFTMVSSTSKAFAFTKPVLKLLAQREIRSDLQALKLAVEQKLH
jgi:carbon monoxide dehydrogenase subunit G